MPIKFSSLVSIPFIKATKLVGLYNDDSNTTQNCIVETDAIAVKSDLKDFVTTQDLDDDLKNYVTNSKHTTDLSNYVTTQDLDDDLKNYVTNSKHTSDLKNYVTNSKHTTDLTNYVTNSKHTTDLTNYVTNSKHTSDLKNYVTNSKHTSDLKNYVTNDKHTSDLKNYVTLNTAQTIDSTKTFTQPITIQFSTDMSSPTFKDYIFLKDTSLDYTVTSQFNKTYYTNSLRDKNGKYIGYTELKYNANGSSSHSMCARTRRDNGNEISASIGVTVNKDGTIKTFSPTPPFNDNSTQIATTEFVKYILFSSGNGLATFSKGTNGFYKFANGLIVQWGESQANHSKMTVTLPTAFTSGNSYQVFTQYIDGYESAQCTYIQDQTATSFKWDRYTGIAQFKISWFAIGY